MADKKQVSELVQRIDNCIESLDVLEKFLLDNAILSTPLYTRQRVLDLQHKMYMVGDTLLHIL